MKKNVANLLQRCRHGGPGQFRVRCDACGAGNDFPATPNGAKDFQEHRHLASILVTAPYAARSGDRRADGFAGAHADAVYKFLNLVPDEAFTAYLKRKLGEWYAAAP